MPTYQSYPPSLWAKSAVTSVTPPTAAVGATPTLTINGSGFTDESVVSFDGDVRPTTYISETQLTATLATITGTARTVQVTVSTGGSAPFVITSVEEDEVSSMGDEPEPESVEPEAPSEPEPVEPTEPPTGA